MGWAGEICKLFGSSDAICNIVCVYIYIYIYPSLSLVLRGRGFASPARTTDRVSSLEELLLLRTRAFGPLHLHSQGPGRKWGLVESPVMADRSGWRRPDGPLHSGWPGPRHPLRGALSPGPAAPPHPYRGRAAIGRVGQVRGPLLQQVDGRGAPRVFIR